jgi:hypothetical protein
MNDELPKGLKSVVFAMFFHLLLASICAGLSGIGFGTVLNFGFFLMYLLWTFAYVMDDIINKE